MKNWLLEKINLNFSKEFQPHVIELENGDINLEWIQPFVRIELEINYKKESLELYSTDFKTGKFTELVFPWDNWEKALETVKSLFHT